MAERVPIILDVDTGVDDALALALATALPEIELVAVTTVAGNIGIDNAMENTRRVLSWLGATDVPVHRGASRPIARAHRDATYFHGTNGLGDARLPASDIALGPDRGPAAMIRHALARPGEMVLVCVGPLTNLAIALNVAPELPGLLRKVVIMGGAFRVAGNVRPHAEFNIWCDPEAAAQVFEAGFPDAVAIGLDVTHQVPLDRASWDTARANGSPTESLIKIVTENAFTRPNGTPVYLHDPFALAFAIDPALAEIDACAVEIDLDPEFEGRTRIVGKGRMGVARDPDRERFLSLFKERTGLTG